MRDFPAMELMTPGRVDPSFFLQMDEFSVSHRSDGNQVDLEIHVAMEPSTKVGRWTFCGELFGKTSESGGTRVGRMIW